VALRRLYSSITEAKAIDALARELRPHLQAESRITYRIFRTFRTGGFF